MTARRHIQDVVARGIERELRDPLLVLAPNPKDPARKLVRLSRRRVDELGRTREVGVDDSALVGGERSMKRERHLAKRVLANFLPCVIEEADRARALALSD